MALEELYVIRQMLQMVELIMLQLSLIPCLRDTFKMVYCRIMEGLLIVIMELMLMINENESIYSFKMFIWFL